MSRWQSCSLFLALAWVGVAMATPGPLPAPQPLAVVYDEADEAAAGDYARIIAGIADRPDVVLYRIALRGDEVEPVAQFVRAVRGLRVALQGEGTIGVVYPDIGEPYRGIFSKIIEGIEDKTRTRVASFAVGAQHSPADLIQDLRRHDVRVVIALGRHGLKAVAGLDRDFGIVLGGVVSVPEGEARGMAVSSLAPDPQLLFERLRQLMPGVRRVFAVFEPRQNAWLMKLARDAARVQGLELVALEAPDLKTAMRHYQEIVAAADPRRDALWLPQDSVTVEESAVLPLVLQEAWNRPLAVFSSSVAHVRRGALFSLYPNNVELGRNLAGLALGQLPAGGGRAGILPLRDVLTAVNLRTASHLGLPIDYRQQQGFDMVFPEP